MRAYKIQWRTERIVDIQFDMTLCGCPCSAFEDNAGMMVSSDGIFRSRGERALAFAIAANVQGISAATSIQDPASISIPSSTTNSRKDSGEADSSLPSNECNTQVRVSMQAPLDKINILDETGNGIGSNSPEISEFYEEVQMELGYAVDTGNLKRFLLELDFPIVEVCSAPNEWYVFLDAICACYSNISKHMITSLSFFLLRFNFVLKGTGREERTRWNEFEAQKRICSV